MLYCSIPTSLFVFFFFNDTATTEIYTLSLHDALPICYLSDERDGRALAAGLKQAREFVTARPMAAICSSELAPGARSEEHTSELQSQSNLVCRLLLEKKKKHNAHTTASTCRVTCPPPL